MTSEEHILIPPNVSMDDIGLDGRSITYQSIDQIQPFPGAAAQKVRTERDIGICDVVIGDASKPPVPNVIC